MYDIRTVQLVRANFNILIIVLKKTTFSASTSIFSIIMLSAIASSKFHDVAATLAFPLYLSFLFRHTLSYDYNQ